LAEQPSYRVRLDGSRTAPDGIGRGQAARTVRANVERVPSWATCSPVGDGAANVDGSGRMADLVVEPHAKLPEAQAVLKRSGSSD
jgi:hypothetical protein